MREEIARMECRNCGLRVVFVVREGGPDLENCPVCRQQRWAALPPNEVEERSLRVERANAELRTLLSRYQRDAVIHRVGDALAHDQMWRVDRHRESDGVLRLEDARTGENWWLTIRETWAEEMGT